MTLMKYLAETEGKKARHTVVSGLVNSLKVGGIRNGAYSGKKLAYCLSSTVSHVSPSTIYCIGLGIF